MYSYVSFSAYAFNRESHGIGQHNCDIRNRKALRFRKLPLYSLLVDEIVTSSFVYHCSDVIVTSIGESHL